MKKLDISEEIVQVFIEAMSYRDLREEYIASRIWNRHKSAAKYAVMYNESLHKAWLMVGELYPEELISTKKKNWRLGECFITIFDEDE